MEDVNKQRRNFISLSELGYGHYPQSKWVGIIAIKTERTQIHFLSDVSVDVGSLDLKVPTVMCYRRKIRTFTMYSTANISVYLIYC